MAIGRPLCVLWYEPADDEVGHEADDVGVGEFPLVPSAGDHGNIDIQFMSVAEICKAAGYWPPSLPSDTARDVEIAHDKAIVDHEIERFNSRRGSLRRGASWAMLVRVEGGEDFEWAAYEERPLATLTKMALARCLQVRGGLNADSRKALLNLPKTVLVAAMRNDDPGTAAAVLAAGPAHAAAAEGPVAAPAGPAAAAGGGPVAGRGRGARGGAAGGGAARGRVAKVRVAQGGGWGDWQNAWRRSGRRWQSAWPRRRQGLAQTRRKRNRD